MKLQMILWNDDDLRNNECVDYDELYFDSNFKIKFAKSSLMSENLKKLV